MTQEKQRRKKIENITEYNRNYMKNRYKKNPLLAKKQRNSLRAKLKYNVDDSVCNQYKDDLHHIIRINQLVNELNTGNFEKFLMNKHTLHYGKNTEIH